MRHSSLAAALEAGIAYLCIFTMPIHPVALFLFQMASFSINVYGHLGYEFSQHTTTTYAVWNPLRYVNRTIQHHDHHKRWARPLHVVFSGQRVSSLLAVQGQRLQQRQLWAVHHRLGSLVLNAAACSSPRQILRLNFVRVSPPPPPPLHNIKNIAISCFHTKVLWLRQTAA
jgi:hypothetical protein